MWQQCFGHHNMLSTKNLLFLCSKFVDLRETRHVILMEPTFYSLHTNLCHALDALLLPFFFLGWKSLRTTNIFCVHNMLYRNLDDFKNKRWCLSNAFESTFMFCTMQVVSHQGFLDSIWNTPINVETYETYVKELWN